jgi:hypothetical protein
MHLYFFASRQLTADRKNAIATIKATLHQTDLWVSSNTEAQEVQASAEVIAAATASDTPLMDRMDAFILEGTVAEPEIGFLLAHAMAMKKPTLYLYQRGTVPEIFQHLNRRELPKFITVVAYQPEQLQKTILTFLHSVAGQTVKEIPRIKFTLRLTGSQDEYLDFKTRNSKTTKADFLRDRLEEDMAKDAGWNAWRKKHRTTE